MRLNKSVTVVMVFAMGASAFAAAPAVSKKDIYDSPKVTVLENRKYSLHDELTFQTSYLANDPFVKYLAGGLTYTHTYSDSFGWEYFNANYALAFDSGLKRDLIQHFGVAASSFDTLQAFGTTNAVWSPVYTKNLLFNSSQVHSAISLVAGGGVSYFQITGLQAVFDFGVMLRYFLGRRTALKLDFRDYVFPSLFQSNNLTLIIGFSWNIGSTESRRGKAAQ